MDLVFRSASRPEREAIERLLHAAFAPYVGKLGRELAADAFDWIEDSVTEGHVYAAVDGDQVVGTVVTRPKEKTLELQLVAVAPERQGAGIGAWLLDRVEDAASARGFAALTLNTAEIMDDLLRLYRRQGYVETRRAPSESGKDAVLRVHLRKALPAG